MLKSTEIFEPKHYKTSQQVQQLSITVQNLISDINALMSNIDNVPTANSDNLISSGAVYTALENISASGGQIQVDWNQTDSSATDYIKNKPDLSNVGAQANWNETNSNSPSYIQNKPNIPAAQVQADWNQSNSSAKDYIKNKPTVYNTIWNADFSTNQIPSIYAVYQALLAKQDNLLGVETVNSFSPTDYIFIERDGVILKLLVSNLYNVPNDSSSADAITMENGEVLLTENGEELLIDSKEEEVS